MSKKKTKNSVSVKGQGRQNSDSTLAVHAHSSVDEASSSTDHPNVDVPRKKNDPWFRFRIVILLAVLIPLLIFGGRKIFRDQKISKARFAILQQMDRNGLDILRDFEKQYGKSGEIEFLRARAYRHLNDTEKAEQHLAFAKQLEYNAAMIRHERTLLEAQSGSIAEPEAKFTELLNSSGLEIEEIFSAFCMGSLTRMQFEDVFKLVGLWMKQDPSSAGPYTYLGMLAQYKYQWQMAEEAFASALKKRQGFPPALFGMAETKRRLNRYDEAVPLYQQYLLSRPESVDARVGLAESLLGSQRSDEARKMLEELITEGQKSFELRLMLGKTLFDLGDFPKAMETLLPLRELWPEDIELTYTLARTYAQLGQDENADPLFKKTEEYRAKLKDIDQKILRVEAEPGNVDLLYDLGHLQLHHVSREEGRVWLLAALQANPRHLASHQDMEKYYVNTGDQGMASIHRAAIQQLGGKSLTAPSKEKPSPTSLPTGTSPVAPPSKP